MSDYLNMNSNREIIANEKTKYELRAIVSSKKKSQTESEYHTVIRKSIKGERFKVWFAYNKG